MQFVEEAFDQIDDENDVVLLKDAYNLCISLNFKDQLGIKRANEVLPTLKMNGYN